MVPHVTANGLADEVTARAAAARTPLLQVSFDLPDEQWETGLLVLLAQFSAGYARLLGDMPDDE